MHIKSESRRPTICPIMPLVKRVLTLAFVADLKKPITNTWENMILAGISQGPSQWLPSALPVVPYTPFAFKKVETELHC